MSRMLSLVFLLVFVLSVVPTDTSAAKGTTCIYEYNATAGNFLIYKYRNGQMTSMYATDRPPGNCEPVPAPTVTLSWLPWFGSDGCLGSVSISGFSNGSYDVTGLEPWDTEITVTGGPGSVATADNSPGNGWVYSQGQTFTATVNGVSSAPSTVSCTPPA